MKHLLLRLISLSSLVWGSPWAAEARHAAEPATSYTVNSNFDHPDIAPGDNACVDANGHCTLRAAIIEANAHAGPDTIVVPVGLFRLDIPSDAQNADATGDLDLLGQVTLQGAGADETVIDASDLNERAFDVHAGAQASLRDITITGGNKTPSDLFGGGLFNEGTLTLTRVSLTHNNLNNSFFINGAGLANAATGWLALNNSQVISNEAQFGAIYNAGAMTINSSQVLSNVAAAGGGIYNTGTLTVSSSQVVSNFSGNVGGGLFNAGQLKLIDSLVGANTAPNSAGLYLVGGVTTIRNSTIRDNQAAQDGGGFTLDTGVLTLTASALLHNSAARDGGGILLMNGSMAAANTTMAENFANRNGGAVWQHDGFFSGYSLTIANNFANADDSGGGTGGGLYREITGTLDLFNTILATNLRTDINHFGVDSDCAGNFGIFDHSLLGSTLGCTFSNIDTLPPADPQLLPLAANGGPTLTMALAPTSPAVDAADPAGCAAPGGGLLLTDQRGLPRHADGNNDSQARCDIGAYEIVLQLFLPLLRR